jgi:cytochrome P450
MTTSTVPESGPPDTPLAWDPYDTAYKSEPHAIWRRLRDQAPLYRNDEYDFWALSRFSDVMAAHLDPRTFSSGHGTVLETMTEEPQAPMMIFMDQPDHTRLRRLVSRAFTPRRVADLEPQIRQLCGTLLDAQRDRGSFDYVQDFGAIVPATVIAMLLGVPEEDRRELRENIDTLFHIEPDVGMFNDVAAAAGLALLTYIGEQLEERQRSPRDDMFSDLVTAEVVEPDGSQRRLTPEEGAFFGMLLVSAGTETVARLLGWAGSVLADHPDQRAELAADPSLIPGAVEELLRFEPPSPVQGRWTTAPIELYSTVVPAGSKVLLLTGSAGRDDRTFADADRFDIHRKLDQHVSFGSGIHFCLGAALARLEARIALEETLVRFPQWEVDRSHSELLFTSTVRGYSRLPIVTA